MSSHARGGIDRIVGVMPRGGALPDDAWATRHRGIVVLAALHVPVLAAAAAWESAGTATWTVLLGVALLSAVAGQPGGSRSLRSSAATLSLLVSTGLLIDLFHGLIELHFHFFVVIAVVAMYQSWTPYLLALGFVLAHHVVMGLAMPMAVYNHGAATAHPVLFALVHAGFVLAESVACLTYWKFTEQALDREREQRERAETTSQALTVAHRELSDLVAMVSHDLRTPLTVMIGQAELALEMWDDLDDPARQDALRRAQIAGRSLEEMLSGTLTLSMLDSEGLRPRPGPFRLDTEVREAFEGRSSLLPGADLSGLQPVMVLADRQHVLQVVGNLMTNASKYGEAPYAVTTRYVGSTVELVVADSGAGVPTEFVARLFDRYSRSEAARRGRQRGTGLGLYIVRVLLQANGGDITYQRRPGHGASFTIALPAGPHLLAVEDDRGGDGAVSTTSERVVTA